MILKALYEKTGTWQKKIKQKYIKGRLKHEIFSLLPKACFAKVITLAIR